MHTESGTLPGGAAFCLAWDAVVAGLAACFPKVASIFSKTTSIFSKTTLIFSKATSIFSKVAAF